MKIWWQKSGGLNQHVQSYCTRWHLIAALVDIGMYIHWVSFLHQQRVIHRLCVGSSLRCLYLSAIEPKPQAGSRYTHLILSLCITLNENNPMQHIAEHCRDFAILQCFNCRFSTVSYSACLLLLQHIAVGSDYSWRSACAVSVKCVREIALEIKKK